jgi:hypothetical protein
MRSLAMVCWPRFFHEPRRETFLLDFDDFLWAALTVDLLVFLTVVRDAADAFALNTVATTRTAINRMLRKTHLWNRSNSHSCLDAMNLCQEMRWGMMSQVHAPTPYRLLTYELRKGSAQKNGAAVTAGAGAHQERHILAALELRLNPAEILLTVDRLFIDLQDHDTTLQPNVVAERA